MSMLSRLMTRTVILGGPDLPTLRLDFTTGILSPIITYTGGDNGTYFDGSGILQTSGADEARFDHDTSGAPLGLLIEEARTNHFLNSGAPATQTSGALATGEHTLWMVGTGSVAVAANTATITGAGTATEGSPVTFDVTVGGTVDYTVTGSPTRVQSEKGSFATSYIPTVGSSITRTADVATIALSDIPRFSTTEGTVFVEVLVAQADRADNAGLFAISTGSFNDSISVYDSAGAGNVLFRVRDGGADQANISSGASLPSETKSKIAAAWKVNDFGISIDGSAAVTDSNGSVPTALTTMQIGRGLAAAGHKEINGHILRLDYWNETKSDLQAKTA